MARKKPGAQSMVEVAKTIEIESARCRSDPRVSEFPGTGTSARINAIEIPGSRNLITVTPDWPIWRPNVKVSNFAMDAEGAIVRLRPPIEATDADVERVRAIFYERKAARVTVLPRPKAEVVPAAAASRVRACGAREAVLSLVGDSNSGDKDALRKLCEAVMAERGL